MLLAGLGAQNGAAQEARLFRIGTGGIAGTYFPIGGLIASAISQPTGSRPCDQGGSCGVAGLIAAPLASNGSVANIQALQAGAVESAFAQADVVAWAYTSTGVFEGRAKADQLRAIASLYRESVHLVARRDANIRSVGDLRGKRVSLDEPGSGTLIDARLILSVFGLSEKDLTAEYLKPNSSGERLKDGSLDAFFFVGGYPAPAIGALIADRVPVQLVPIDGPQITELLTRHSYFATDTIPANAYLGLAAVATVSIGAQWITSAGQSDELIYGITKALWHPRNRRILDSGHIKGRLIQAHTALSGLAIPLHPGAERFYRELGLLK